MILEEQARKYRALDYWFKTPQGFRVARAFVSELKEAADFLYGKQLLQLGCCGDNLWLPGLNYRNKWFVTPCETAQKSALVASLTALPVDRNSMDCVVAPLTIEAFGHDKNPIDEIDRVLKPMGHAVFFGVNPWSFWGAALKWNGVHCFGNTAGIPASSLTLKHAMLSRGYSLCLLNTFYYIPPVANKRLISCFEFFNEMGKMIWPFPPGFYCLVVQKYQPATPAPVFNRFCSDMLSAVRN